MPETKPLADPTARARSVGSGTPPKGGFAALVPELGVTDLDVSLCFWCGLLGFAVAYDRPATTQAAIREALDAGFPHIVLGLSAPYPDGVARWVSDELISPSL